MSETTVIEIGGVKLEVDLRTAKRIDTLQVGSKVKVLQKKTAYGEPKIFPGVVIGFEPFPDLPTILIAYLEIEWQAVNLRFLSLNGNTESHQVIASVDDDKLDRTEVGALFDRDEAKAERVLQEIREKRAYFDRHFGAYWTTIETGKVPS